MHRFRISIAWVHSCYNIKEEMVRELDLSITINKPYQDVSDYKEWL